MKMKMLQPVRWIDVHLNTLSLNLEFSWNREKDCSICRRGSLDIWSSKMKAQTIARREIYCHPKQPQKMDCQQGNYLLD